MLTRVLDSVSQTHTHAFLRGFFLPRRVLEVSKTCRSCRVLCSISWLLQTEPLVLVTFWWDLVCLHIWRQDAFEAGEAGSDGLQRKRPHDHRWLLYFSNEQWLSGCSQLARHQVLYLTSSLGLGGPQEFFLGGEIRSFQQETRIFSTRLLCPMDHKPSIHLGS